MKLVGPSSKFFIGAAIAAPTILLIIVIVLLLHAPPRHRYSNHPPAKQKAAASTVNGTDPTLKPLETSLATYLDKNAPGSSVYLEDLSAPKAQQTAFSGQNGHQYNAKSLMKVPLVMNMYEASEQQKLDLDTKMPLKESELDKDYGNLWRQGAGYQISLRDASRIALQDSDNTAIKFINDNTLPVLSSSDRVYNLLDVQFNQTEDRQTYITPQQYSIFIRCLYDACYLTRENSDTILQQLSESAFKAPGADLPRGTRVAHKIGNVDTDNGGGYDDCGIVYGPKKPFLYCIMLTTSEPAASPQVSAIVKTAYDFIEK